MTYRRFLASSQVRHWHNTNALQIPARYVAGAVPQATVVKAFRAANSGSGNTTCSVAYTDAQAGDTIIVLATHIIGALSTSLTPSCAGLTFTQEFYSGPGTSAVGVWKAVAPDSTSRTVTLTVNNTSAAGFGMFIYVVRGASTVTAAGWPGELTSASSHTIPSFDLPPGGIGLIAYQTQDDNSLVMPSGGFIGAPSGVSASNYYSSFVPANAWDGNDATYWNTNSTQPAWTVGDFGTAMTVDRVGMCSAGVAQYWDWQGSDNGSSWTTLASGLYAPVATVNTYYTLAEPVTYRYFRFYCAVHSWTDPRGFTLCAPGDRGWQPAGAANIGSLSSHLGAYRYGGGLGGSSGSLVVTQSANGPDIAGYVYAAVGL